MKVNRLYAYSAVLGTLMKFYNMKELAEAVADELVDIVDTKIEVYNTKSDGFVLRKKVDIGISAADVYKASWKAIKKLIQNTDGDIESYLSDQYDIEYDEKMVNHELVSSFMDIELNGRMIIAEFEFNMC